MKAILLTIGIGLMSAANLWAQQIIRVKGGQNWQKSIPLEERYRYRQFLPGKITYLKGEPATGRLNFNILLGEMQFIDARGDTLSLANEQAIKEIQVGENAFAYDSKNGYVEIIAAHKTVKMGVKPVFKTVRGEKNGGYGQSSGTSSITQYKSFAGSNGQLARLEQPGDLLLEKDVIYLLIDQNNRFYKFTKASLLKIYAKYKSELEAYLKAQNPDFKKEEDLKKLLLFCADLT
ncbi:hypothetical protein [Tellurirhabdus bombi]|uniref:hypothetical protein n=1 Tax=Tellurirhabdus bombi TaxID=2907205 RepID=UPI001F202DDD|nr:hypothetical protein [Tellurirhabdus bombi]